MITEAAKVVGTDTFYDLKLYPDSQTDDWDIIRIREGQAKLYFNKDSYDTAFGMYQPEFAVGTAYDMVTNSGLNIKIYKEAVALAATTSALALLLSI